MIIIADGHELAIGAGHRNEQTSGTPQGQLATDRTRMKGPISRSMQIGRDPCSRSWARS